MRRKRSGMISSQCVTRIVAGGADLMEQVAELTRNGTSGLKTEQQVDRLLFGRGVFGKARSDFLCHPFAELAKLQQAGIGTLREVVLCECAQLRQLFVMNDQVPKNWKCASWLPP